MPSAEQRVPKIIRIFAAILVVIGLGAGISGYVQPDLVVPQFAADTAAQNSMAMMFAGRNLALGIMMLAVFLWGMPEQYLMIFAIRFMIELADLTATLANAPSVGSVLPLAAFLGVVLVLEASAVIALQKIVRRAV